MIGKRQSFIVVNCFELEVLIWETYPKSKYKYEIIAFEEWSNDTDHNMTIDGKLDEYDEKDLIEFKNGNIEQYHCSLHMIMNDMARNKVIKKGKYSVEICW